MSRSVSGCRGCTRKIIRLLREEREHAFREERRRMELERTLLAARAAGISYDQIAGEIVGDAGGAATADEHVRIARNLRQRMLKASQRVSGTNKALIAHAPRDRQDERKEKKHMNPNERHPVRRRVEIEETWYEEPNRCTRPDFDDHEAPPLGDHQLGDPTDHED